MGEKSQRGEIIVFRTNKIPKKDQVKLSRSLYGFLEKSFHSKYTYPRPGILDQIPHIRPLEWRAILVTRSRDAIKVIQILEEYGAQIYSRTIQLEQEDLERLEALELEQKQEQEQEPEDAETKTQKDQ